VGFWSVVEAQPDDVAVVADDGSATSFHELWESSNRLSNALASLGLTHGDGLAIVLPNELAFLEAYLAAMQSGLYLTCINFHLTGPEIAYILGDCEATVLLASSRYGAACAAAAAEVGIPAERRLCSGDIEGFRRLGDVVGDQSPDPPPNRRAGQTMLYTSGTTGQPKGVRRPIADLDPNTAASLASMLAGLFDIPAGPGAHLVTGPLYHAAPLGFGTGALHLGQTLVLMDRWDPLRTLELIATHSVATSHMVPTMFHRLLAVPEPDRQAADTSSLRSIIHGAAPCPVEVKRRILEWWGPVIYEYYGATEGGGAVARPDEWLARPGTVGRPWPGSTIQVLDDAGRACPPGEPGAVYMSSAIGDFEYHNDRDKTDANRLDGMFTVGDIGYLDEDGWLFLCDRKADMVISGGVNIYPAEIEAVLLTHPGVGDAAVLGVPDEEWGESVKAVIEPAPGVEPSDELAEELLAYCRERLAAFKCPRSLDFRAELPRLPTGKLYKRFLRDEYWTGIERRI
jgi:long-chain acyl-CoA synthetase